MIGQDLYSGEQFSYELFKLLPKPKAELWVHFYLLKGLA